MANNNNTLNYLLINNTINWYLSNEYKWNRLFTRCINNKQHYYAGIGIMLIIIISH